MKELSPDPKPFPSYSQRGAILELLNPAYDTRKPTRIISNRTNTKELLLPRTPLHVRVRRALETELREHAHDVDIEKMKRKRKKIQPMGRIAHLPRQDESPAVGTYEPQFQYVLAKSGSVSIGKADPLPMINDTYATSGTAVSLSPQRLDKTGIHRASAKVIQPHPSPGIDWRRATERGPLFDTSQGATEGRFAAGQKSAFSKKFGVRFQAYLPRGDLFPMKEFSPDYSPSYSFVSSYPLK